MKAGIVLGLLLSLTGTVWAAGTAHKTADKVAEAVAQTDDYIPLLEQSENRLNNYLDEHGRLVSRDRLAALLQQQPDLFEQITQTTVEANRFAQDCITTQEDRLTKNAKASEGLGEIAPGDALLQDKTAAEKTLAECRLLNLRAANVQETIQSISQQLLRQRLFVRSTSLSEYGLQLLQQPDSLQQEFLTLLDKLSNLPVEFDSLFKAFAYGCGGLLMGLLWSLYRLRDNPDKVAQGLIPTSPALATLWGSLLRSAPLLLSAGLVNLSLLFNPPGLEAINSLALSVLVLSISYTVLHALLQLGQQPHTNNHKLFFWGRLLLYTTLLGTLFHSPLFDSDPPATLLGLWRMTLGTLVGLALGRLVWLLRKHLIFIPRFRLLPLVILGLLVAIGALWTGYTNFSVFLFRGIFGTLFILLLSWLLIRIPVEVFDGLDEGHGLWQQRLRNRMGLVKGDNVPGLVWLRLLHIVVAGGMVVVMLLRLWGMSEQTLALMAAQFVSGYEVGGFTLEPMALLSGVLVLSLLIIFTQFIKRSLSGSWLRHTNLSRGARETIVTITGYSGTALAVFTGLSVAGINFSNLAIIAGALSVGIGFGLQNVVSNFISGLILLFERPIRRGDWVRVGAAEGYVKDISIRSTVIQTFDHSDIIVPNSDLIANQVTNMMLNNALGRIIIPLRVAYGTDTGQVMSIMRQVAEKHPAVLCEDDNIQAKVFLRSFGETAMNFELRCIVRDVESVMTVTSELNLALEKAFRSAGIEFPLPQQVVRLAESVSG